MNWDTKTELEADPFGFYEYSAKKHAESHLDSIKYKEAGDLIRAGRSQRIAAGRFKLMDMARTKIIDLAKLGEKRSDQSFGEMFHTALRKGVDTKWSVVLWNYINCLGTLDAEVKKKEQVWRDFTEYCQTYWEAGLKPSLCAKKWTKRQYDWNKPYPHGSAYHAFVAMIELCDQETWDELDSTIEYWETI